MRPLEFTLLFVNESLGMLSGQFAGQEIWEAVASGKGAKTKVRAVRARIKDFNRIPNLYIHAPRRGLCEGNKGAGLFFGLITSRALRVYGSYLLGQFPFYASYR